MDMPDSEMIEKVAKAIYDATGPLSGDTIATVIVASEHLFPGRQHTEGNSSSKAYQFAAMDVCRSAASAAIEAMMEPTPQAIEAIKATVARQTKGFHLSNDFAAEIWRSALSPSLKEQEEGN